MEENPAVDDRWFTIAQTAEHIGVTPHAVRKMVHDNRLRAYTCGPRIVRLRLSEIDAAFAPYGSAGND